MLPEPIFAEGDITELTDDITGILKPIVFIRSNKLLLFSLQDILPNDTKANFTPWENKLSSSSSL